MTVDTAHGIITGVDYYSANQRESDIILKHIDSQIQDTGLIINRIALDAGYDIGAVHRGFEHLGITDYCSPRIMHNNALKKGFTYNTETDSFVCMKDKRLNFYRIAYKNIIKTITEHIGFQEKNVQVASIFVTVLSTKVLFELTLVVSILLVTLIGNDVRQTSIL